jgi:hypothetical protein
LLDSIDSRELSEWAAFADMEPFGDDWRRTGEIGAILHNVHRKKEAPAVTAEDMMPIKRQERYQSPQQVIAIFKAIAAQQALTHGDDREP